MSAFSTTCSLGRTRLKSRQVAANREPSCCVSYSVSDSDTLAVRDGGPRRRRAAGSYRWLRSPFERLRVTSLVDGLVGEEIEGITARRPFRARRDPAPGEETDTGFWCVVAGDSRVPGAPAGATPVRVSLIPASAGDEGTRQAGLGGEHRGTIMRARGRCPTPTPYDGIDVRRRETAAATTGARGGSPRET